MIDSLLTRFPEHRDKIEKRFAQDPIFREICEDYVEISRLLANGYESAEDSIARADQDYRVLLEELEKEILQALRSNRKLSPGTHSPRSDGA
jgi:hypothetical protein